MSSGIATGVAEILTLPICNIKTNFQNSKMTMKEVVRMIYNQNGIKGFYNASFPAITSQIISTSSKYTFYRFLEDNFENPRVVNGLISGITSSLLTHPVDFLKIHLQMRDNPVKIVKKEGISVIYRGYSKSFGKIAVGSILFFPLYDLIKEKTNNPVSAALFSSIVATTTMQPLDYLKIRHVYNQEFNHGLLLHRYYRGLTLNLMRVVPHFVIVMTFTEFLKENL